MARTAVRLGVVRWRTLPLLACFGLPVTALAAHVSALPLTIEVYRGGFASVNSFIISNGHTLAVIDVQRKLEEARKLANLVRSKKLPLAYVLISHGHTDHFTGMAYFHSWF